MIVDIIQKTKTSFSCYVYNIGNNIDVINNDRVIKNEKLIYNNYTKAFMKVIKYLVGKRTNNLRKINTSKKKFKAYYLPMKTKRLDGYSSKILIEF